MTNSAVASSGNLRGVELLPLYFRLYREKLTCTLVITSDRFERKIYVVDGKLIFASSNAVDDSLGRFMVRTRIIDEDIFARASRHMKDRKVRFGRALLEMKLIDYERLWYSVKQHMKEIIFRTMQISRVDYRIIHDQQGIEENITLDSEIPEILADSLRQVKNQQDFITDYFADITNIYVRNPAHADSISLREYEKHVLDLVKRGSELETLIEQCELLKEDTLKILYLFLSLGIVSTDISCQMKSVKEEPSGDVSSASIPSSSSFSSFEEALGYYNRKYVMVFKSLTKEIGPIAYSIISKALDEVSETLPGTLKKVSLCYDGRIEEEPILKAVWYHDFDKHIAEFVRGLEELLYAELFAIKKHLGPAYEQQILKWINTQ